MQLFRPLSRSSRQTAFTLIELLTVLTILVAVTSLSVPAFQTVLSASKMEKAASDLSGAIELARTYAMANHTYVRMGISDATTFPGYSTPATVVVTFYPMDGTLDAAGSADMADASKWQMLGKALILSGLQANDQLGSSTDDTPSATNIASFSRNVSSLHQVEFKSFIQCNPNGETCVSTSTPSRYIKWGWNSTNTKSNPFVLRISGINGTISVLHKEDL